MKRSAEFDVADIWRRYWPLMVTAACGFVAFALVCLYLLHRAELADRRQQLADQRNERQRQAICAILANIPGQVPTEIRHARTVFAPSAHPDACRPVIGATPKPTPVKVYINGKPATIIVNPPSPAPSSSPSPSRTASPRPTPAPSRSPSPKPKPKPTPTCLHVNPIHLCVSPAKDK